MYITSLCIHDKETAPSNVIMVPFLPKLRASRGFLGSSMVKDLPANAGDARDISSIPVLKRCPGEENGNPLQYSCLKNSMDRGAWQAAVHGVTKLHDCATNFHFFTSPLWLSFLIWEVGMRVALTSKFASMTK